MVEDVESSPIRLSLQEVRDASLTNLNFYLRKKLNSLKIALLLVILRYNCTRCLKIVQIALALRARAILHNFETSRAIIT